jgi:hypothetical protein
MFLFLFFAKCSVLFVICYEALMRKFAESDISLNSDKYTDTACGGFLLGGTAQGNSRQVCLHLSRDDKLYLFI